MEKDSGETPIWIDENHIDCKWLASKTGSAIENCICSVKDISNAQRRGTVVQDGATLLLTIETTDTEELSRRQLVVKQVSERLDTTLSRQLGLAREAKFYKELALLMPDCDDYLPKTFYAHGDMESGIKFIVMEHLDSKSWYDSGVFFGPGNPNNWNRDLPQIFDTIRSHGCAPPESSVVAMTTFRSIARVHGFFWKKETLLDSSFAWLRGHGWLQQSCQDSWEASQNLIRQIWSNYCQAEKQNTKQLGQKSDFQWSPIVRSAVEKAVDSISWQSQVERLKVSGHWTLVHGDFWPGNVMWNIHQSKSEPKDEERKKSIRLLDWEMVGIGSGPQDLGQYVLSNFKGSERRACEKDLVKAYYEELVASGVKDVSFEYCWKEYMVGGIERWLWFLVWFLGQGDAMNGWAQFFHDQMAEFIEDHNISLNDITQPRP